MPAQREGILFTSFEPSGDDHASAVIAELRRRRPTLPMYAWGGPKMERAGATIVARTGQNAVMGVPGLGKIAEHVRINRAVKRWLRDHPVALHVPVDSPAANFPICRIAKASGARVVHLVAPQVWAWAEWRVKKLRRLTDLVLCLLPFEENWFNMRGVKARFVGHPLFDDPLDYAAIDARIEQTGWSGSAGGAGKPRLALMPGSRPAEWARCFPILLDMFRRLRADFPETTAVVAATRPDVADQLREIARGRGGWPPGMHIAIGDTDAVVRWCEYAVVVSGTVTLQVAKQLRPMVTFYRPGKLMYHTLGRWLVSTELFTLPNLTAGSKIVPELIPHFDDSGEALAIEVIKLMRRPGYADDQRAGLARVVKLFEGRNAAEAAADEIEKML
jgi:lipid-A-disaccharide synthase